MSYPDNDDLTKLATLKAWLLIPEDQTAADAALTTLINRASQFLLELIARPAIFSGARTEKRNGNGAERMFLKGWPITAVSSVKIDLTTVPASADSVAAGYVFDDRQIYLIGYYFARGFQNVTITYTGGIVAESNEQRILEQACLELCAQKWKRRDHVDQNVKASTGVQFVTFSQRDIPAEVRLAVEQLKDTVIYL